MQTVSTAFKNISTASVNEPVHNLKVSWLRRRNGSADFAVVGTSIVGGFDIVGGDGDIVSPTDLFEFYDESDYVLDIGMERYVVEPLGGILYARAKISVDNTNKRFSPSFNSTIGTALLPYRPIRVNLGYKVAGIPKAIPKFKGLLNTAPKGDRFDSKVTLEAFDYMSFLDNKPLESAIYQDQTIDQIIEDILLDAGFSSEQFNLQEGLNNIEFAWFNKNQTAGKRIRLLCEAEEASFFQEENGQLILQNRRIYVDPGYNSIVHTIHARDIVKWRDADNVQRINRCVVKAKPRSVKSSRIVWESLNRDMIGVAATIDIFPTFVDPVTTLDDPVANVDYKANTAQDGSGTDVTEYVSVTIAALFTTSAKLTITNTYSGDVYMVDSTGASWLKLRGTPATVDSEIEQIYEDVGSQDELGQTNQLIIDNDFIDDPDFAYYLARAMVRKYKDGIRRLKLDIPAVPHLQLKDLVEVEDPDTEEYVNYRVVGIVDNMQGAYYMQTISLRESTPSEADTPAIVGISLVDGPDVVWI